MMDPERQGEIALKIIKYTLRKQGVMLSQDGLHELTNIAQSIGEPAEEVRQFARILLEDFFRDGFM